MNKRILSTLPSKPNRRTTRQLTLLPCTATSTSLKSWWIGVLDLKRRRRCGTPTRHLFDRSTAPRSIILRSVQTEMQQRFTSMVDIIPRFGSSFSSSNLPEASTPPSASFYNLICRLFSQLLQMSFQRGWKPLHFAAQGGHLPCVQLLLGRNARASSKTKASTPTLSIRMVGAGAASTYLCPHICLSYRIQVSCPLNLFFFVLYLAMSQRSDLLVCISSGMPVDSASCCLGRGLRRRLQMLAGEGGRP